MSGLYIGIEKLVHNRAVAGSAERVNRRPDAKRRLASSGDAVAAPDETGELDLFVLVPGDWHQAA